MGGAADRAALVALRGRTEVDQALRDGQLISTARGRYALATSPEFVRRASAVDGVLSHRSAAQFHGWAQKAPPTLPEVTVPRDRHLRPGTRKLVTPHWCDLDVEDVAGIVTTPRRTLVDCMRNLPFDVALAIVDSAIRGDDFTSQEVIAIADATRGRGRERIRRVAREGTSKSANPFESALRGQALLVPGLHPIPQLAITVPGKEVIVLHPDLADPDLGIAFECESFEWHGKSAELTRDCRRYNTFTLLDWIVIRFSWVLVMHDPDYVRTTLERAVALARQRAHVAGGTSERHTCPTCDLAKFVYVAGGG